MKCNNNLDDPNWVCIHFAIHIAVPQVRIEAAVLVESWEWAQLSKKYYAWTKNLKNSSFSSSPSFLTRAWHDWVWSFISFHFLSCSRLERILFYAGKVFKRETISFHNSSSNPRTWNSRMGKALWKKHSNFCSSNNDTAAKRSITRGIVAILQCTLWSNIAPTLQYLFCTTRPRKLGTLRLAGHVAWQHKSNSVLHSNNVPVEKIWSKYSAEWM